MKRIRILVIARGHLGDLITALPALRDLRRANPDAHITALVNEYVRSGLNGCPFVDDVIYGFIFKRRSLPGRLRHVAAVLWRVVARYDVAISLRSNPRLAPVIAVLSGARIRVGFAEPGMLARLLTHHLGAQPSHVNTRVVNLLPVTLLSAETSPEYPAIDWLPPAVSAHTSRILDECGVGEREFAVLQLSSNWGCNEWSSDKWAVVADHLVEKHGLQVVAVGTDDAFERAKHQHVSQLMKQEMVSLHGRTSVAHLLDLVGRASLVLACDSALTQIALAQRTPSVILFGIEPLEENGPLPGEIHSLMEPIQHWEGPGSAPLPNNHCQFGESYCHTEFCRENSSLQRSDVEEVKARVDTLLARADARRITASADLSPAAVTGVEPARSGS